jgi:hypothetical protein
LGPCHWTTAFNSTCVASSPLVINDPNGKIENLAYARDVSPKRMDHRESMVDVLDEAFARRGGGPAVEGNRAQRFVSN